MNGMNGLGGAGGAEFYRSAKSFVRNVEKKLSNIASDAGKEVSSKLNIPNTIGKST